MERRLDNVVHRLGFAPNRASARQMVSHGHVQVHGRSIPKSLLDPLTMLSEGEPDPALRGKLLTLKALLAPNPGDFVNQLKGYNPPILPAEPVKGKEPPKP